MDRPTAPASTESGGRLGPIRTDLTALLGLSGPVVISRLGIMAMGLCDTVVVGRYSAQELGYHALAWAPTSVILTFAIGLLTGVNVMTARRIGEGRRDLTGAVLRRGLVYSFWIGLVSMIVLIAGGPAFMHAIGLERDLADGASRVLVIFALSLPFYGLAVTASMWLEGQSRPGPGAWAMWAANVVNLGLLLLLVPGTFGLPALGAVGGAWATTGARAFLVIAMLAFIARMPEARALGVFSKPERDRPAEIEQRRIGYGAGASNFFEVASFAGMNIIAGWIGGLAVAAFAITLNVASIIFMVPLGLATGAAVLVGKAYGARDLAAVNRACLVSVGVAAAFGLIVSLIVWPTAALIAQGYTKDAATIALAAPALILCCLFFLPDAIQVIVAQSLRARGDVWVPTYTHLFSYIVIMSPLAWWLAIPMKLGVNGIIWAIIIATLVSCGLLLGRFRMLSRRAI